MEIAALAAADHPQGRITEARVRALLDDDLNEQAREARDDFPFLAGDDAENAEWIGQARDAVSRLTRILARAKPILGTDWLRRQRAGVQGLDVDLALLDLALTRVAFDLPDENDTTEQYEEAGRGVSLRQRWGAPPFSVLDASHSDWQARRAVWEMLDFQGEVPAGDDDPEPSA